MAKSDKSKKVFKSHKTTGTITIEGIEGGDKELILLLEDALEAAKENKKALAAEQGEARETVFENLDVGRVFSMAHRS